MPQGTVLGAIFFTIYINDITRINHELRTVCFAYVTVVVVLSSFEIRPTSGPKRHYWDRAVVGTIIGFADDSTICFEAGDGFSLKINTEVNFKLIKEWSDFKQHTLNVPKKLI